MKNIRINHAQQGFTLIELMIVVAIIGILAAIAIPQYQDYISRSQISRAVGEVSALKTAIEEELMRGDDPSSLDTTTGTNPPADFLEELGWTGSDLMATPPTVTNASGAVVVTATLDGNVNAGINGGQIVLSRTTGGSWTCVVQAGTASDLDGSMAPAGCPLS